ncbi:MAG: CpsD/CapB family tyrosine-protein kinase [Candidatus Coprovivens sp.]
MDELVLKNKPKSTTAEEIRVIRTNIEFSLKLKKEKTILITSSVPREGKSFISSNLAISFAQKGLKVLLVDSDLRVGRLHKIFRVSNQKGFSDLLVDDTTKTYKPYIKPTKIENLFLITRGTVPPNPSELLDSENVQKFINTVQSKYDIIIFDGTPINGLTDSLVLSKYVDKVAIVSAANYTKANILDNTIRSLKNLNAEISGIILNKLPQAKNVSYYKGYYGKAYTTK